MASAARYGLNKVMPRIGLAVEDMGHPRNGRSLLGSLDYIFASTYCYSGDGVESGGSRLRGESFLD